MAQAAVVIDLDSDDEVQTVAKDKDKENDGKNEKKSCNPNCINFKCDSGEDMKPAPSFAIAFYGVNMSKKKKKKRHICKSCLDTALDHQEVSFVLHILSDVVKLTSVYFVATGYRYTSAQAITPV